MDVAPSSPRRARWRGLRVAGFVSFVAAVALAVLLVLRPSWAHVGSERSAWTVVAGLVVLGVLLMLATVTSLVVAVVAGLVAYIVVAAPVQPQASSASGPGEPSSQDFAAPAAPTQVRYPTLGISAETIADLDRFSAVTGTRPEVFDMFVPWSRDEPLDRNVVAGVVTRGAQLSITWEPWDPDRSHTDQPRYSLASIIGGAHDAYIDRFAESVKQIPATITIRLMHEMNGTWYPWGDGVNGNRPGSFVRAWRHVHDRFAALGVTNVRWLWAPNAVYTGGASLAPLYPGDDYVDAVGLSNYNWGDYTRGGVVTVWNTFDDLFDSSIAQLRSLTARPIWIAEVASSDKGGSRAAWIAATLAEVRQRPEIAGLIWFDHVDDKAGVDWRIEQDPDAVAAWRTGFDARPFVPNQERPGRHAK